MKAFILLSSLLALPVFAGYDASSDIKCDNGTYKLHLKRKGSFFGENSIKLSKSLFNTVINEKYEQDWSPEGETVVEKLAKKELPCSNEHFYQFSESENSFILESYTQGSFCEDQGEVSTIYVQLKKENNKIVKFNKEKNCKQSYGM